MGKTIEKRKFKNLNKQVFHSIHKPSRCLRKLEIDVGETVRKTFVTDYVNVRNHKKCIRYTS